MMKALTEKEAEGIEFGLRIDLNQLLHGKAPTPELLADAAERMHLRLERDKEMGREMRPALGLIHSPEDRQAAETVLAHYKNTAPAPSFTEFVLIEKDEAALKRRREEQNRIAIADLKRMPAGQRKEFLGAMSGGIGGYAE